MGCDRCCGVFRFLSVGFMVCFLLRGLPLVYVFTDVMDSWHTLHKAPQLQYQPYPPELFYGERTTLILMAVQLAWAIVWTVALVLGKALSGVSVILLIPTTAPFWGWVDLGLGISTLWAVIKVQSQYVPSRCNTAATWFYDLFGIPSPFTVLAQHWPLQTEYDADSKTYVVVPYIAQGVCEVYHGRRNYEIWLITVNMVFASAFVLLLVAIVAWQLFTTIGIASKLLTRRVAVLTTLRRKRPYSMADLEMETYRTLPVSQLAPSNDQERVHFATFMRGALLADATTRATTQERPDRLFTLESIRQFTCIPGEKRDCWACGGQICDGCKCVRSLFDSPVKRHISECQAICTRCWIRKAYHWPFKTFRGGRYGQNRVDSLSCWHRRDAGETGQERDICSSCASETSEALLDKVQRREKEELESIESADIACSLCYVRMRAGLIWWICSACGEPCNSSLHATWVTNRNK